MAAAGSQTSPLISSKKRFEQQGKQAVAAELERVEDPNAVSLLEEHGDQGRADVTGSAGDEYSHRRLHPWWLETRLERRGCVRGNACGKARRADQHARPSSLRPSSVVLLGATGDNPFAPGESSRPSPEVVLSGRHYRQVKTACQRHFGLVFEAGPAVLGDARKHGQAVEFWRRFATRGPGFLWRFLADRCWQ